MALLWPTKIVTSFLYISLTNRVCKLRNEFSRNLVPRVSHLTALCGLRGRLDDRPWERGWFSPPSIYGPSEKGAGYKSKRKNLNHITYSADTEDEVNNILKHLSVSYEFRNNFYSRGTASNEGINKPQSLVSTPFQ